MRINQQKMFYIEVFTSKYLHRRILEIFIYIKLASINDSSIKEKE